MEDGMAGNVGLTLAWLGAAISGYVVAFAANWLVTIVIFSLVPVLFVAMFIMIKIVRAYSAKQIHAYNEAGAIASEVISNVRTVLAFNKQEYEVKRYRDHLAESRRMGMIKTMASGVASGLGLLIMNSLSALAFWWGNKFVFQNCLPFSH